MLDWLREKRQPARAIERFWRQVLVSAINEELDRMAASHGFQVFRLGFLATPNAYEMGIPAVPLGHLYSRETWNRFGNVELYLRTPVTGVATNHDIVRYILTGSGGEETQHRADFYVSALPFEKIASVIPGLAVNLDRFEHSPITGIHLWFDAGGR